MEIIGNPWKSLDLLGPPPLSGGGPVGAMGPVRADRAAVPKQGPGPCRGREGTGAYTMISVKFLRILTRKVSLEPMGRIQNAS